MKKRNTPKKPPTPDSYLLKLSFPKFPKHEVKVYFEKEKLEFRAQFGFEEFRSPSVPQLKQKIDKAIKAGATPEPEWKPMIEIWLTGAHNGYGLSFEIDLHVTRAYYCFGRSHELLESEWSAPPNKRPKERHGTDLFSGSSRWVGNKQIFEKSPVKTLSKPTFLKAFAGIAGLIPYTDELWQELQHLVEGLRGDTKALIEATKQGTLDALQKLALDFPRIPGSYDSRTRPALNVNRPHKKPKLTAPAKSPKSSVQPMTGKPRKQTAKQEFKEVLKAHGKKVVADAKKVMITDPVCICVPKRRADQIRTNPYCKFPHAGKLAGSFRGEATPAIGNLDPAIAGEFRKALNLKLLKGLLESKEFGLDYLKHGPTSSEELMIEFRNAFREGGTIEVQLPADGPQLPPHLCQVTCKGGPGPAVWFKDNSEGKPDLKGKELIAAVREVLNIPCPLEHLHGKKARKEEKQKRGAEFEHRDGDGKLITTCICYPQRGKDQPRQNAYCEFPHYGEAISYPAELRQDVKEFVRESTEGLSPAAINMRAAIASSYLPANAIGNGKLDAKLVEALGFSESTVVEINFQNVHVRKFQGATLIKTRDWLNQLIELVAHSDESKPKASRALPESAGGQQKSRSPVESRDKPGSNGARSPGRDLKLKKRPPLPNGPVPAEVVAQFTKHYPAGTKIEISRRMGNGKDRMGNISVTPPGHVTERYSIRWLEKMLDDYEIDWPAKTDAASGVSDPTGEMMKPKDVEATG